MTRTLPKADEGDEAIQFRGPQTSVTHDQTGVHFTTEVRNGRRVHRPIPVVDPGDDSDIDGPTVARPVAEYLTESNPLICWGVVCEQPTDGGVCGAIFSSQKGLNSHLSVHSGDAEDGDDGGDSDD